MRRLRGRVRRPAAVTGLGLTSMLDILTNLLVFLLVTAEPADAVDLDLPVVAADVGAPTRGVTVDVSLADVRVDGEIVLTLGPGRGADVVAIPDAARRGGRLIALHDRLIARAPADAPDAELLLRCDQRVPFAVVRDVLATAGEAGFGAFRLVAVRGGP